MEDLLNLDAIKLSLENFRGASPFDHCIVDGFFKESFAQELESDFPEFSDNAWYEYDNLIECKKALNDWNKFPSSTYKAFQLLNSPEFLDILSEKVGVKLYPDNGLHGGGWHIHGSGGNLNPHYDYSIHPKLGLQRKINIIMYVSQDLKPGMGGELGLWHHNNKENAPSDLEKEVFPLFNRAVIFDTTQNSWHGMSKILSCPQGIYRKSLAIYYLCDAAPDAPQHQRALFAPREFQKGDEQVKELIKKRADLQQSREVYIKK